MDDETPMRGGLAQRSVRLWDGARYDRAALDRQWPGLADYAARHAQLMETVPYRPELVIRRYLRIGVCGVGLAAFAMLAAVAVATGAGVLEGVAVALVLVLFGLGVNTALFFLIAIPMIRNALPQTVCVKDGVVRVTSPRGNVSAPLSQLAWHEGWAQGDWTCQYWRWFPRRRAIVLLFPTTERFGRTYFAEKVACGLTEESRLYWKALLTLAKVPGRL